MQRDLGNDLSTPRPEYGFPGLRRATAGASSPSAGCRPTRRAPPPASSWPPPTSARCEVVPIEALRQHAVDVPDDISGLE